MNKQEFIQAFQQRYGGFICVSDSVVGDYYDRCYKGLRENDFNDDCILDFCQDFILSQGLEEEVVE